MRVAVLYAAQAPPAVNGNRKPMKTGGYSDSGADICFALRARDPELVVAPVSEPDATKNMDWVFPDTYSGESE